MRSVEEALSRILQAARLTEAEELPLDGSAGRVLADRAVIAGTDVPPFANSSMDGYALRAADAPGELRVIGEVAAGAASLPRVTDGTAVRIMTGAPMPPGADAVVPLEQASEVGERVRLPAVEPGAFVRAGGHDTRAGEQVELPADPLTPAAIAVLASLGMGTVAVRRRPTVAILSTGDELVSPGERLAPGQIYDANSFALGAAVAEAGGVAMTLRRAPDEPVAVRRLVLEGAGRADVLIVSGGVSVGSRDHVRAAIEDVGHLDLWRIAVQPGKPLAFGSVGDRPVIGLPGNPVSALVTFELFVRPLLRAMLGLSGDGRIHLPARAEERIGKDPARRAYLRVVVHRMDDAYWARAAGGQASSQLRPLAAANGLLVVPEGTPAAEPGEPYDALLLGAIA
jgi:molybdopterin molybdotransferase